MAGNRSLVFAYWKVQFHFLDFYVNRLSREVPLRFNSSTNPSPVVFLEVTLRLNGSTNPSPVILLEVTLRFNSSTNPSPVVLSQFLISSCPHLQFRNIYHQEYEMFVFLWQMHLR